MELRSLHIRSNIQWNYIGLQYIRYSEMILSESVHRPYCTDCPKLLSAILKLSFCLYILFSPNLLYSDFIKKIYTFESQSFSILPSFFFFSLLQCKEISCLKFFFFMNNKTFQENISLSSFQCKYFFLV